MRSRCQSAALLTGLLLFLVSSPVTATENKTQADPQAAPIDASDKNKSVNNSPPPANQNSTAQGSGSNNPAPEIKAIIPTTPLPGVSRLIIQGANFQKQLSFTFSDPKGGTFDENGAHVSFVSDQQADVDVSLNLPGAWTLVAKNPKGPASKPLSFNVSFQELSLTSPEVIAFAVTMLVAVILIVWIFRSIWIGLKDASTRNQWSFGDAISEESIYQPKDIQKKSDVIIFASTSRLIALVGLLGILALVIGVGFATVWSLFIRGSTPDLSQVRIFLLYSACLFAPYLANQLSGIFTPGVTTASGEPTPAVTITSVVPALLRSDSQPQPIHIAGTGFRDGSTLILNDPSGNKRPISGPAIESVATNLVSASVTLDIPGSWTVSVINLSGAQSPSFTLAVSGAPTISSIDPPTLVSSPNSVLLALVGTGFISGLTVSLQRPGAIAAQSIVAASVTVTRVTINPILDAAGNWTIVVTNPGNKPSAASTLTVT